MHVSYGCFYLPCNTELGNKGELLKLRMENKNIPVAGVVAYDA